MSSVVQSIEWNPVAFFPNSCYRSLARLHQEFEITYGTRDKEDIYTFLSAFYLFKTLLFNLPSDDLKSCTLGYL